MERSVLVARRNPKLIVFPLMTFAACFALLSVAAFGLHSVAWLSRHPVSVWPGPFISKVVERITNFASFRTNPHPSTLVGYYFAVMFTSTFINVALYHELMRVYAGDRISLTRGLCFAGARIAPICCWSLFASTVGVVIGLIGDRFGRIARFFGNASNTAWSVSAVFAIPVLLREKTYNPLVVLRHSAETARKSWGELIDGWMSFHLMPCLVWIFVTLFGAYFIAPFTNATIPQVIVVSWACTSFALLVGLTMISDVYRCAVYIFATEGVVPDPFVPANMDAAWTIKGA